MYKYCVSISMTSKIIWLNCMVDSKENYKFGLGVKELTFVLIIGVIIWFWFFDTA